MIATVALFTWWCIIFDLRRIGVRCLFRKKVPDIHNNVIGCISTIILKMLLV